MKINLKRHALSTSVCTILLTSAISAGFFFGYSTDTGTRVGGGLTDPEKGQIISAINLIAGSGNASAASQLTSMLAANEINAEENEEANKKTGNSCDATGTRRGGYTVHSKRMNMGRKTLDRALSSKSGAIGRLAGSLIHELWHINNTKPSNREMDAALAQAEALCAVACLGLEGGLSALDVAAICAARARARDNAAALRPDKSVPNDAWNLAHPDDCPCCPASGALGSTPGSSLPPEIVLAMSYVDPEFNPLNGVYEPNADTAHDPTYRFYAEPTPIIMVEFYRPSDGGFSTTSFDLNIYPTAITGDGGNTVFIGGVNGDGNTVLQEWNFTFAADSTTAVGPNTLLTSGKIQMPSDLIYGDYNSNPRLFSLDGPGGKLGYYELSTAVVGVLANKLSDPAMTGWRSFCLAYNQASNRVTFELCRKFPTVGFYEFDDELYVLVDDADNGSIDNSIVVLAQSILFPDPD